ncbi:MAG TPA: hypothetical protein VLN59_14825, partial [Burkholderiales bacterium]|nr:hypothetical protein [Burkholderiales bacterium]
MPRLVGNQSFSRAVLSGQEAPRTAAAPAPASASPPKIAPPSPAARKPVFQVSDAVRAQMKADIDTIVAYLRQQILWESDERKILAIVRRWADEDRKLTPGIGTPYIDQFL